MTELKKGIYYVGVQDPTLRIFDIVCDTEFGTTYNAYLVKGEKSALIESVHDKFADRYIKNIQEIMRIEDIDYIICNHTEPDHSGCVEKVLDINPDVTVVGTAAALRNLKEITNRTFNEMAAKNGERLDLGKGKELEFVIAPNLHWPDTMMTWLGEQNVLFSCDVLGAHYCEMGVTDENLIHYDYYERALKVYYDKIVAPFGPFVQAGLAKLADLDIKMVCNSHGPVLVKHITEGIAKYSEWSKAHRNEKFTVTIFYVSAYGYTKMLAEAMKESLEGNGVKVEAFDIIEHDINVLADKFHNADAVMFGSPTLNRSAVKPLWDVISHIDAIADNKKPVAVFGSYGWSGEACEQLMSHLNLLKMSVYDKPFKCIFKPSKEQLEAAGKYALDFMNSVLGV